MKRQGEVMRQLALAAVLLLSISGCKTISFEPNVCRALIVSAGFLAETITAFSDGDVLESREWKFFKPIAQTLLASGCDFIPPDWYEETLKLEEHQTTAVMRAGAAMMATAPASDELCWLQPGEPPESWELSVANMPVDIVPVDYGDRWCSVVPAFGVYEWDLYAVAGEEYVHSANGPLIRGAHPRRVDLNGNGAVDLDDVSATMFMLGESSAPGGTQTAPTN